jgi:hypothetical protein
MSYYGDIAPGQVIRIPWGSNSAAGASITRATNGTVSVYKDANTTQTTNGVTDTEDFDSLTGVHWLAIDTSADTAFYAAGSDFTIVVTGAVIDGETVNGVLASFSIWNRGVPAMAKGRVGAASTTGTVILPSGAVTADDIVNGAMFYNLTKGEARVIVDSDLSDNSVSVDPALQTAPDSGDIFIILPSPPGPTDPDYLEQVEASSLGTTAEAEVSNALEAALLAHEVATISDLDAVVVPLQAAIDAVLVDTGTDGVVVASLAAQAKADVNAEVLDVLNVDTFAEPGAVPAATASLVAKLGWVFTVLRNKITQTSATQTLRNDADNASIATSSISDNGTTFTRNEWS